MKNHKDLDVWKKSISLVIEIYEQTKKFPDEEKFCLTAHLRKTAVSIPSNIAEGAGRNSSKELVRFLYISLGSVSELETQLIIADKLGYLKGFDYQTKLRELFKMLRALINSLQRD